MNSLTSYNTDLETTNRSDKDFQPRQAPLNAERRYGCPCLQPIILVIHYRLVRIVSLDTDFERPSLSAQRFTVKQMRDDREQRMDRLSRLENTERQSSAALN